MQSHELIVIGINLSIASFSYFWLYPRVAGNSMKQLSMYDFISSIVAVIIAGILFAGSGLEFNALLTTTHWLWFSFLSYLILEVPFMLWYIKQYDLFD